MFGNGKVFVSHTHEDNALCEPLLAALDAWQVDYWFDVAQLAGGQEFPERIQQAIRERDILLRICTPAANRSVWLEREAAMGRVLRSAQPRHRLVVNLLLAPGYDATSDSPDDVIIDATRQNETEWLRALRTTLGIPSRERHISRRAVIGLGITSLAAVGASAYAGKLLLTPSTAQAHIVPIVHNPTPTPQSGASHLRWLYRYGAERYTNTVLTATGTGVYVVAGGIASPEVFALNPQDGSVLWEVRHGFAGYAAPTIVGDTLFIVGHDSKAAATFLFALATADGTERWRAQLENDAADFIGSEYVSSVTVADNQVLARYKNVIVAADRATGTIQWWQGLPINDNFSPLYQGMSAPISVNGVVYVCGLDGTVQALQASTGAVIWSAAPTGKAISATPTLANGALYFGAEDGYAYALDAATGALRWQQPLTLDQGRDFLATQPIVANGAVYIGGGSPSGITIGSSTGDATDLGDVFFELDSATGHVIWRVNPSRQLLGGDTSYWRKGLQCTPAFSADGKTIYVTGAITNNASLNREALYALSINDGSVQWSYEVAGGNEFPSSPVAQAGMLYWGSSAGAIYAMIP